MTLIDISRPIYTGLAVWPGDSSVDFSFSARKAAGADANVGRLSMSVHAGTHADAAYHYNESGLRIDEMPLDLFVGAAHVVDIRGQSIITPALLEQLDFKDTPRVLFRSDTWSDTAVFPTNWPVFDPATPAWLAARAVRLIGLDVPSVDTLTSLGMPMHHVIDRAGLFILENLDLRNAAAGVYDLIALPLRIKGGDGSPIRAVLQTRD
jgi:arylformamidase